MPLDTAAADLATMLMKDVGPLFNESNVDEFNNHLRDVVAGGERSIAKRISILFAYWSNLDATFGVSMVADSDSAFALMHLRDYKFAIASELARLCPIVLSNISGKDIRISTQDDFEVLNQLLSLVDEKCRQERLTDWQAFELLMNILEAQFSE